MSPTPGSSDLERHKAAAGRAAVDLVASGMVLGLGTGSTARHALLHLARRLAEGSLERIRGVPTSRATEALARELGIELVELPAGGVDLAIDGMDEVDPGLNAIKGLGGALFREKVVAASARRFVLIGDATKRVGALGEKAPLPVEVAGFGWRRTRARLEELGLEPRIRIDGEDAVETDNGNLVLDCPLPSPLAPAAAADLALAIGGIPGVIAHGFFLGMADRAFVATDEGMLELSPAAANDVDAP